MADDAECQADTDCIDSNPCTDDRCNASLLCQHDFNTAPCDDGQFCTSVDACSGGTCQGSGDACPGQMCDEAGDACVECLVDGDCDDGEVCTSDSCPAGNHPCPAARCNACDEVADNCALEFGQACAPDSTQAERLFVPMYCFNGICTHWCNNSFELPGDSDHECPAGFCTPVITGGTKLTGEDCTDSSECRSNWCIGNRCSDVCSSDLDCVNTGPNTTDWVCMYYEVSTKPWFNHGGCEPAPGSGLPGEACADWSDCYHGNCMVSTDMTMECRNMCCTEDDCAPDRICWPFLEGWPVSAIRACEVKEPRGPDGFGTACTPVEFYDSDCNSGLCVDVGGGRRCNRFCCRDSDCPADHRCELAFLWDRQTGKQNLIRACIPQ